MKCHLIYRKWMFRSTILTHGPFSKRQNITAFTIHMLLISASRPDKLIRLRHSGWASARTRVCIRMCRRSAFCPSPSSNYCIFMMRLVYFKRKHTRTHTAQYSDTAIQRHNEIPIIMLMLFLLSHFECA